LKHVFVRGEYAMVVFDEEGSTTTVDVVKDGDRWKLD